MPFFNVLKHFHPMIGIPLIELHQAVLPPAPTPFPRVPHACGGLLGIPPWGILTGKRNGTVWTTHGQSMSKGTDMGPLIPHFNVIPPAPPNVLLGIIIPTSASKSHFGSHKHPLPEGPVAVAVAKVVNFNLNCAGPPWPPLPSGLVIAFNTEVAEFTIGDFIGGLVHMAMDLLIQWGLNRIFASKFMSSLFERATIGIANALFRKFAGMAVTRLPGEYIAIVLENAGLGRRLADGVGMGLVDNLLGTLVTLAIGSPLGYSPGWSPVGGSNTDQGDPYHQNQVGSIEQKIDDYFSNPAVEEHPSAPPASSTAAPPPP